MWRSPLDTINREVDVSEISECSLLLIPQPAIAALGPGQLVRGSAELPVERSTKGHLCRGQKRFAHRTRASDGGRRTAAAGTKPSFREDRRSPHSRRRPSFEARTLCSPAACPRGLLGRGDIGSRCVASRCLGRFPSTAPCLFRDYAPRPLGCCCHLDAAEAFAAG